MGRARSQTWDLLHSRQRYYHRKQEARPSENLFDSRIFESISCRFGGLTGQFIKIMFWLAPWLGITKPIKRKTFSAC